MQMQMQMQMQKQKEEMAPRLSAPWASRSLPEKGSGTYLESLPR
jgi:hypothetical protein